MSFLPSRVLCDITFELSAFGESTLLLGDEFLEKLIDDVRGFDLFCLQFEQLRGLSAAYNCGLPTKSSNFGLAIQLCNDPPLEGSALDLILFLSYCVYSLKHSVIFHLQFLRNYLDHCVSQILRAYE